MKDKEYLYKEQISGRDLATYLNGLMQTYASLRTLPAIKKEIEKLQKISASVADKLINNIELTSEEAIFLTDTIKNILRLTGDEYNKTGLEKYLEETKVKFGI